jgi:hypothetical protein
MRTSWCDSDNGLSFRGDPGRYRPERLASGCRVRANEAFGGNKSGPGIATATPLAWLPALPLIGLRLTPNPVGATPRGAGLR